MNQPDAIDQPGRDDLLDLALRESIGGRLVSSAHAALSAAWASSVSRRYVSRVVVNWRALPPVVRIRLFAFVGAIAVLINRLMSRLGPSEPLGWIVPSLVLAACALTALLAGPIARTQEHHER